jgi:hypothetical protein
MKLCRWRNPKCGSLQTLPTGFIWSTQLEATLINLKMELEKIILSEVSQAQKPKSHVFSLICEKQT